MTARPTPETDNAMRQMACFADHPAVECLHDLANKLERELGEAVELLRAIVVLDDGDQPDLWHYEQEFDAARAYLARLEKEKP